jgi:hypothetical protein
VECRLRELANRVFRRLFRPKRDEVTEEWRKLHNEEHVLLTKYCSGDQIENEISGACGIYGGVKKCIQGFGWGNLRERDHLEDSGVDGRTILKRIFRKWGHKT